MDDQLKNDITELVRELIPEKEPEKAPETPEAPKATTAELRKRLFSGTLSNVEYVQTAIDLRNATIAEGGDDPFLPHGHAYSASTETVNAANETAEALTHCLEVAQGSDEYFIAELARITKDTSPITARK